MPQEPGDSPRERFSQGCDSAAPWLDPGFQPRGCPGGACSGNVCSGKEERFCSSPPALLPLDEPQVPSPPEHAGVVLVQPSTGSCPREAWTIAFSPSSLVWASPVCVESSLIRA